MFYEIETSQLLKLILLAIPAHGLWFLLSRRWHPLYLLAVVLLVLAPFSIAVDSAPVIVALKYARAYTGFLLLGAGLVMFIAQGGRAGRATWAWIAFSLYYWFAAVWSDDPLEAIVDQFRFVLLLSGGILLGLTLRSLDDLRSAVRILFLGSIIWSVLIIIGTARGDFIGERLAMFGMNPNQVAMGCGFTFLISLTTAIHDGRYALRIVGYACCGVIAVGAILTGSRGGVGALVLGALPVVAAVVSRPGALITFVLASTLVGYVASDYLISDYAVDRMTSMENTRRQVWAYSFDLIGQAPILGHGNTPQTWKDGRLGRFNTHSIYLTVLVIAGISGFLLFLVALAVVGAQHLRAWRTLRAVGNKENWPVWFSFGLLIGPLGVGVFENAPLAGVSIYTLALGMSIGLVDAVVDLRFVDRAELAEPLSHDGESCDWADGRRQQEEFAGVWPG